jgi:hypothetical protein
MCTKPVVSKLRVNDEIAVPVKVTLLVVVQLKPEASSFDIKSGKVMVSVCVRLNHNNTRTVCARHAAGQRVPGRKVKSATVLLTSGEALRLAQRVSWENTLSSNSAQTTQKFPNVNFFLSYIYLFIFYL